MFCASSLLSALLLALTVAGTPLVQVRSVNPGITLPFALRLNVSGGATIADRDRARAAHLISKGSTNAGKIDRRASSFAVTNTAVTYVAAVGVGSPATTYSLLIDTGSSNTWVGAGKSYVRTSTSVNTGNSVSVSYGSGQFSGTECKPLSVLTKITI